MARLSAPESVGGTARRRALSFAAVAILIAAGTSWSVYATFRAYESDREVRTAALSGSRVVVATRDLPAGSVLVESDMVVGNAPAGTPEADVFKSAELLIGQTISAQVLTGEPIRTQRLLISDLTNLRADEVINPDNRAVSIKLDSDESLGSLLRPGTYVDVIITIPRTLTDGSTDWLTATLLQSTRVIAVDDVVAPGPAGVSLAALDGEQLASRLVTLEVGPTEVRQLVHASERGRIHLALRSPANLDFYPYEQQSLNTNTFVDVPAADQARRIAQSRQGESLSRTSERTKAVIQLFKGSKESSFSMDQGGGR